MYLNIAVVAFVGIIAWILAAHGFFSSFLHFVCVVAAGAITFALWEPIVRLFLGAKIPDYANGITIVVVFALSLLLLRVITGQLVPMQVHFGNTANFLGGGLLGIGSGIISIGILLIGFHMIQMPAKFLGYEGWTVDTTGSITRVAGNQGHLWVPVDTLTARFYTLASQGSMYAPNSLAMWYPDLDRQANLSQVSINDGEGRQGMAAEHVTATNIWEVDSAGMPDQDRRKFLNDEARGIDAAVQAPGGQFKVIVIETTINKGAADKGDQVRMTKAQVELVCETPDLAKPYQAVFPHAFIQRYQPDQAAEGRFYYDANGVAASSVGGATDRVVLKFEFAIPRDWRPHHMVVRNVRVDLPNKAAAAWTLNDLLKLRTGTPAPRAGRSSGTKPWIGYIVALAGTVMVVGVTVLDPKRSHQD